MEDGHLRVRVGEKQPDRQWDLKNREKKMSFQLFNIRTNTVSQGSEKRSCTTCGKDQMHDLSSKTTVVEVVMFPVKTSIKSIQKCQECKTKSEEPDLAMN